MSRSFAISHLYKTLRLAYLNNAVGLLNWKTNTAGLSAFSCLVGISKCTFFSPKWIWNWAPWSQIGVHGWKESKDDSKAADVFSAVWNVTWILIRAGVADGVILGSRGGNSANIFQKHYYGKHIWRCVRVCGCDWWQGSRRPTCTHDRGRHTPTWSWIIGNHRPRCCCGVATAYVIC